MTYPTAVLFGGSGFIGRHFAAHLLEQRLAQHVWLCDLVRPPDAALPPPAARGLRDGTVRFAVVDVRQPIEGPALPDRADLVVNLAAVHREPGHRPAEYFETNVSGAEHVCAWSARIGCPRLVFTSSIAPYGPSEEPKSEASAPAPETPYGRSKLAAEEIHLAWQRADGGRRLVIVRPGVVFGPGEGGHVSLLIRAVLGRYFVYIGSRHVLKAGGYVKELCHTVSWVLERQARSGNGVELYNFTLDPPPSVANYVEAICKVAGVRRFVPRLPYGPLYATSVGLQAVARALGKRQPFDPVRLRKLVRSNHVVAEYLRREGYPSRYTLEQALLDWRRERPDEWGAGPDPSGDRAGSGAQVRNVATDRTTKKP